jgi:hypothetical protein
MDKIGSRSGDRYLHRKTDQHRDAIRRKLAAYHRFIQIALIAQGVPQCIATTCARPGLVQLRLLVLHHQTRNSPIRTGRDDRSPKFTPDFLIASGPGDLLRKFLRDRLDLTSAEGFRLAG